MNNLYGISEDLLKKREAPEKEYTLGIHIYGPLIGRDEEDGLILESYKDYTYESNIFDAIKTVINTYQDNFEYIVDYSISTDVEHKMYDLDISLKSNDLEEVEETPIDPPEEEPEEPTDPEEGEDIEEGKDATDEDTPGILKRDMRFA